MIYLGVDPGVSGAIAGIDEDSHPIGTIRFSETWKDVDDWLTDIGDEFSLSAHIEQVASTPQMGVVSSFKFGRSFGFAHGLLVAHGIRHEFVSPGTWQRALRCLSKGDKNVTKRRAQALWPQIKITHAVADALLIAEFGRRIDRGVKES